MASSSSSSRFKAMITQSRNKQNTFFGSSVANANINIDEYLLDSMNLQDSSATNNNAAEGERRPQQRSTDGYIPSFEGTLSLGFSIHIPCDHTLENCSLDIDDESQDRLESLVMLFMCSQGVDLVISTDPTTLVHVCPFNNNGRGAVDNDDTDIEAAKIARTSTSVEVLMGEAVAEDTMILWNLPRFESETIAFDDVSDKDSSKTIVDMATNTTFVLSSKPKEFYTALNFTYPVYQWGPEDSSIRQRLQDEFDDRVVGTGTLDSLLPWPGALAAPTGDEPYVFWDEPLPGPVAVFDTTLPEDAGMILRYVGGGLVIANTLSIILLTLAARCQKKRRAKKALWDETRREERRKLQSDYLDTEAGVSAILMESKHYALTKSEQYASRAAREHRTRHGNNNSNHSRGAHNITGVEVCDLRMADQQSQQSKSKHSKHSKNHPQPRHYDHLRSSHKEGMLLAEAHRMTAPTANLTTTNLTTTTTQWFSGEKLLGGDGGNGDDDDAYDDEEAENLDLQILDLSKAPPMRRTGSKLSTSSNSHSRSRNSKSKSKSNRAGGGETLDVSC